MHTSVLQKALCGLCCWAAWAAAEDLEPRPNYQPPTVAELKLALDGDVEERFEVLTRVTPRGFDQSDRAQMVQLLIPRLNDEDPHVRSLAAQSLTLFGKEAKPALPTLISRLNDAIPTRTPTTIVSFEGVWVLMSKAIAAIGPDAIDPLLAALPDSKYVEFYGISAAFSEMGPAAKRVAPTYIDILRHGPKRRRWAATYTLARLGEAALPAIPDFVANLDEYENFNIQVISCRALAKLGRSSQVAVPRLLKLTDDGILSARTHSAMCLGAIGPLENVDLVELFSEMLTEINAFSQERGLIAIGRLGRDAEAAAPLIDRLIDEDFFSQKPEAAYALYQVTGKTERCLAVLQQLIDNPTYDHRVFSVLQKMGPAGAPLADRIVLLLDSEDQSLRLMLVEVLQAMGPAAANHVDALKARLHDSSREVVLALDEAIAHIEGTNETP